MAGKRGTNKAGAAAPSGGSSPIVTGSLLVGAIGLGVWTLVSRRQMSWPPTQLLANLFTVAGCLAVIGPVLLLSRKERGEGGLGELVWLAGGLMIWVFDIAAILRGEWRSIAWTTPLSYQAMGLTILAVALAGWRWRAGGRDWSWTNVTGWILGLFWVGMGLSTMTSTGSLLALAR